MKGPAELCGRSKGIAVALIAIGALFLASTQFPETEEWFERFANFLGSFM